jgi:hypothetical protein
VLDLGVLRLNSAGLDQKGQNMTEPLQRLSARSLCQALRPGGATDDEAEGTPARRRREEPAVLARAALAG